MEATSSPYTSWADMVSAEDGQTQSTELCTFEDIIVSRSLEISATTTPMRSTSCPATMLNSIHREESLDNMPANDFLDPDQPEEGAVTPTAPWGEGKTSYAAIAAAAHKKQEEQALPRKSEDSTPRDSGYHGSPTPTDKLDVATPVAAGALSTRLQALEISSRTGIEARHSSPGSGMNRGTRETSPVDCGDTTTLQSDPRPGVDEEWESLPVERGWTQVGPRRSQAESDAERLCLEIKARRTEKKARLKAEKAAKKAIVPTEPGPEKSVFDKEDEFYDAEQYCGIKARSVDASAKKRAARQKRKRVKKAADKARAAERAEEAERANTMAESQRKGFWAMLRGLIPELYGVESRRLL